MSELQNVIGGVAVAPASGIWVERGITPDGTGELAAVPESDERDVRAAVQTAREAQTAWAARSAFERADFLRAIARQLREDAGSLASIMCAELGKPIGEAHGELENAARVLEYYAGLAHEMGGAHLPSRQADVHMFTRREPRGTIAIITPWNFPVNLAVVKLAPALLAGNTAVWKPASQAAQSSYAFALSIIKSGLPAGVVNMVLGGGAEVGTPLTDSDIDGVSFTGSCTVGQQIESRCSARGVRTITELGGKNVAVVCADADLDAAVEAIVNGAFRFAGQKCTATSRVVVLESVQAEFIALLMKRMHGLTVGYPADPTTFMGPLISQDAVAEALSSIEEAVAVGAELLAGGRRPDALDSTQGAFLEPTVLAGVTAGMRIATEELFAPVLVIITARDTEEAIALADRTDFGLTAAIFTNDLGTAFAFVDQADVGAVQVNLPTAGLEYQAPVGGRRGSGSGGVEQGIAALDFYTRTKSVSMRYRTIS